MSRNLAAICFCGFFLALVVGPGFTCHQEGRYGERCPKMIIEPDTGRTYVVYQESTIGEDLTDTTRLLFKLSDNFGYSWSTPIQISQEGDHHRPRIAVDDAGGVYIAWYDTAIGAILWAYSLDHGINWTPQYVITNFEEGIFNANPDIAVHRSIGGDVTVKVVYDRKTTEEPLTKTWVYTMTADLGENWTDFVPIHELSRARISLIQDPDQEITNSYLAHMGPPYSNVLYSREADEGGYFETPLNVSQHEEPNAARHVGMAVPTSDTRYIVWATTQYGDGHGLTMSSSFDEGENWLTPYRVWEDGTAFNFVHLTAVAEGGTGGDDLLYLVTIRSPGDRVAFFNSLDSGLSWNPPLDLCPPGYDCTKPSLLVDSDGELFVIMRGAQNRVGHLFSTRSDDGGLTWAEPVQFTGVGIEYCEGFAVTINGTPGHDVIDGTSGPDVIQGYDGNDTIRGFGGDDVICGGPGNDTLVGNNGTDVIFGGDGNDTIKGKEMGDFLFGGSGNDTIAGGTGDDELDGEKGNDTCNGDAGTDTAEGCEVEKNIEQSGGDSAGPLGPAKIDPKQLSRNNSEF
jgi:hypothetical protein